MANYVRNLVYLNGADIQTVLDSVKSDTQAMDFNMLIPMPKELLIESSNRMEHSLDTVLYCQEGKLTASLKDYYQKEKKADETLKTFLFRMAKEKNIYIALGLKAYRNKNRYGYTDWYGWSVANWGTKWNAMDSSVSENKIVFDTAWSPASPVIAKLAGKFPDMTITHVWSDEDSGRHCGWTIYSGGREEDRYLAKDHTSEAYEIYEECWGKSSMSGREQDGNRLYRLCEGCSL